MDYSDYYGYYEEDEYSREDDYNEYGEYDDYDSYDENNEYDGYDEYGDYTGYDRYEEDSEIDWGLGMKKHNFAQILSVNRLIVGLAVLALTLALGAGIIYFFLGRGERYETANASFVKLEVEECRTL